MTLLNTANDGWYSVFALLCETVAKKPITEEDLLALCSDGIETKRIKNTLNRWTALGLFEKSGGEINFSAFVSGQLGKNHDQLQQKLPGVARRVLFKKENNKTFWDSEKSAAADFTRGVSWLLAQDVYEVDLSGHPKVQKLEIDQLSDDKRLIQNDVRWGGLRTWSKFLGFLTQLGQPLIDPTCALREDLPLIFGKSKELAVSEFCASVAEHLPVLDGGTYRRQVEENLTPESWRVPGAKHFSTSLSRALKRLEHDKVIEFKNTADPPDYRDLMGSGGQDWGRVTDVMWKNGAGL